MQFKTYLQKLVKRVDKSSNKFQEAKLIRTQISEEESDRIWAT